MRAFLSYQTADRLVAAKVRTYLSQIRIDCFMAHDDIEISHEWRGVILEALGSADIFVALLSANYLASPFCVQESGIAVVRDIPIIPLSLDGTISPGFMSVFQSRKIDPANIDFTVILAGIARKDIGFVIDRLIDALAVSPSFRDAETRFRDLAPYPTRATDEQTTRILNVSVDNGQIGHASLCARDYLPPILATHGDRMDPSKREKLQGILADYQRA